jgi:transposase-like protein
LLLAASSGRLVWFAGQRWEEIARRQDKQTAVELGIHPVTLSKWLRQADIHHGLRPSTPSR